MNKFFRIALCSVFVQFAIFAIATAETLVFQDSFNGALSTNWQPGTNTAINPGGHRLTVADGRLIWNQNRDYVESKLAFKGDFRIEVDLERTLGSNQCWDFAIELTTAATHAGVLRMQYGLQETDSINIGNAPSPNAGGSNSLGVCVGDGGPYSKEMPTTAQHVGTAIMTYQAGNLSFGFINLKGSAIAAGPIAIGAIDAAHVRIWGMSAYRFVDEVRVYDLSDTCPADVTLLEVGPGGSYDLTIPSLCFDGQVYDQQAVRIRLNPDGTWIFF